MLVVDSSGSIATAGAEQAVTDALNAFLVALNDTGSELGLIDFDTLATVVSPLTPLSTASGSFDFFTDYANGFSGDGRTNWDDALFKAIGSGADLTLFITDGKPNEYANQPPHSGHTGNPPSGEPAVVLRCRPRQHHQGRREPDVRRRCRRGGQQHDRDRRGERNERAWPRRRRQ